MFSFMLKNKTQSVFVGSVATLSYSVGILVIYLHSIGTACLLSCVLSFKQDTQGLNRNDSTTDDSSSDDGDDADTPSTSKKKTLTKRKRSRVEVEYEHELDQPSTSKVKV